MVSTRTRYILSIGILISSSTFVHGQSFLTPETEQKIQTLHSLQTLSALLVKPSVIQSASSSTFRKGACPQSNSILDDVYALQTINDVMTLPSSYVPSHLVDIRTHIPTAGNVSICITQASAQSLYRMYADMKKENMTLLVVSGYRSYGGQKQLYSTSAKSMNTGEYDRVAPAGQSEHQLGTAIDIANSTTSGVDFGSTQESAWIQEHAHEYGFIVSYDVGEEEKTGYMYEPWHLRYVGVSNAVVLQKAAYKLSYKADYYRERVINTILTKLKEYVSSYK